MLIYADWCCFVKIDTDWCKLTSRQTDKMAWWNDDSCRKFPNIAKNCKVPESKSIISKSWHNLPKVAKGNSKLPEFAICWQNIIKISKQKLKFFLPKDTKSYKLLPSVGIFLNIGKNCQKATLIWPDDQITRRRWAKIDVVGCMGCWWTKVDAYGWRWMKLGAGGQKWMKVDESGCRYTHVHTGGRRWTLVDTCERRLTQVDAGGQKWMKVDLGGFRWMQMDKIGCMWMKVDAGGPEYDVRVRGIPGTGIFSFFWWYRNRYRKNWFRTKSRN